jgi:MraZ protein
VFRGANALSLDAKGRLTIPTRYRDLLQSCCQGRLVATVDHGPCLLIYPQPNWEVIEKQLSDFPNFNQQTRQMQRLLIGFATECEMDGHGRILLAPTLREFAGLDKRVMLIGQVNKFELWDEPTWTEQCKRMLTTSAGQDSISDYLNTLSL